MASKVKIDPLNINYDLVLNETFSQDAQRQAFADFAQTVIEEAKEQNRRVLGQVPKYTVAVDGREGAPLTSVRLGGTIFVEFELVFEAIAIIHQMLKDASPVKSGRYQRSHVLVVDGIAIDEGQQIPIGERYVFVNTQPYARKIERGLSPKAPHGVYQAVAQMAKAKYGNIARIKFGYETPLFGAIEQWAQSPAALRWAALKSRRRQSLHAEWLRRQPAIIVTLD